MRRRNTIIVSSYHCQLALINRRNEPQKPEL
ncbi:unnamed protein product [Schistosoma mattheei]|uniref:Uncharacterized protein n=1 Tax=Schistosoma mattheei TaxID=31246 RepID=A0A183NPZ3_9TREM|nr:unnamed protein product [Schistosoma mattheei]